MNADGAATAVAAAIERSAAAPVRCCRCCTTCRIGSGTWRRRRWRRLRALHLSRAEVHGVLTFYHHFRRRPPGRHVLRICRAEASQSMGAVALMVHAESALGCQQHATTTDGAFTLEPVFCLGLCALAPSAAIDDELHARLTPARLDPLIAAALRADAAAQELP